MDLRIKKVEEVEGKKIVVAEIERSISLSYSAGTFPLQGEVSSDGTLVLSGEEKKWPVKITLSPIRWGWTRALLETSRGQVRFNLELQKTEKKEGGSQ